MQGNDEEIYIPQETSRDMPALESEEWNYCEQWNYWEALNKTLLKIKIGKKYQN